MMAGLASPRMPAKVVFFTPAYNAEKTLDRAIKSVLNQTYNTLEYYVLNNGSSDATGDIIRSYMAKDSRVHLLENEVNEPRLIYNTNAALSAIDGPFDYFAFLDADDEYKPDFLKASIDFAETNDLDMVCCGTDNISLTTEYAYLPRRLPGGDNWLFDTALKMESKFPFYHHFMRTVWGKLYKSHVMKNIDFEELLSVGLVNGADTQFVFAALRYVKRFGVMAGTHHVYYVYPKSLSRRWVPGRFKSNTVLDETARGFLIDICGSVSPRNNDFLHTVYMGALIDTYNVLVDAQLPEPEKISAMLDIFSHDRTKRLASHENLGNYFTGAAENQAQRKELFSAAADWLLALNEVPDDQEDRYCDTGELLCAAAENSTGWLTFKYLRVQFMLQQGRDDEVRSWLEELAGLMPDSEEVQEMLQRNKK